MELFNLFGSLFRNTLCTYVHAAFLSSFGRSVDLLSFHVAAHRMRVVCLSRSFVACPRIRIPFLFRHKNISQARRAACSPLSMTAAAGMGGTVPDVEDDVDVFASLRPLTEGPVFIGLQVDRMSALSCHNLVS